ncbi:hypothetical protein [Sphingomonas sp.]|uniref:hypothetical protein n=1 Tax=Sphingomonas sp. TaxID=28214 RepID=UPI003BA9BE00
MTAVIDPLYARRNMDLEPIEHGYTGGQLTELAGATASLEVRQYEGAAGAALISKSNLAIIDEPYPTDEEPDLRLLIIDPGITRAELAALPGLHQPEIGSAQTFWFEIKIHYANGTEDSLRLAPFIVYPGVNTL